MLKRKSLAQNPGRNRRPGRRPCDTSEAFRLETHVLVTQKKNTRRRQRSAFSAATRTCVTRETLFRNKHRKPFQTCNIAFFS